MHKDRCHFDQSVEKQVGSRNCSNFDYQIRTQQGGVITLKGLCLVLLGPL
jgi:hypothetical protein